MKSKEFIWFKNSTDLGMIVAPMRPGIKLEKVEILTKAIYMVCIFHLYLKLKIRRQEIVPDALKGREKRK